MTYGIVFIMLLISGIIGYLSWCGTSDDNIVYRLKNARQGAIIPFIILSVIIFVIIPIVSYSNYIVLKQYKSGMYQQYAAAVNEYNRIISEQRGNIGEITDLKFQGFQQPMVGLIKDHRGKLSHYNKNIIGKRILAKNCLIGCVIFEPDSDMDVLPFNLKGEQK